MEDIYLQLDNYKKMLDNDLITKEEYEQLKSKLLNLEIAKSLEEKTIPVIKNEMKYICKICGYVHEGLEAPEQCPVCRAPKKRFEITR